MEAPHEIGGYFGLELPVYGDLFPDAFRYQSARGAIRAILQCNGIKRVMLPVYICNSVFQAAADAGVAVETYDLDESLYPINLPRSFPDQCVFLYVNYFGLCQNNVARLAAEIPNDRLIIDNCQALFAKPIDVLATIYSPRKFAGLPDGGLITVSPVLNIALPTEEDQGSVDRMRHMLMRTAFSARDGYVDFQQARDSLKDTLPLRMSRLTQRIMRSICWEQVSQRRRENFKAVAKALDGINNMRWQLGEGDVPLCYPLLLGKGEVSRIKNELAVRNIFVPTYWPGILSRIKEGSIEAAFINETLFLPIDQRLDSDDVATLVTAVVELTGGNST